MQGSYLEVCRNPKYDHIQDILTCQIGAKVLQLQKPYMCGNEISVNLFLELQC